MDPSLEALLKVGDLDQARAGAEQRLKARPGDREALIVLAKLATFEGRLAQAGELVARATLDGVEDTDSLLVKAALATETSRDPEPSLQLYERAIREGKGARAEPYFGQGLVLASAGRFAAARKPLQRAVELEPGNGQYHFHLARALLAEEQLAEGLPHLERAIELNPLYLPNYEACVFVLTEFGELEAARTLLEEGLKLMPDHPFLLGLLSNVLVGLGKAPEATALAQRLAAQHPTDTASLANYARLLMATGHQAEALELVQTLAAQGKATAQTRALEGMLLEARDPPDEEGALVAYATAARQDPRDWGSLVNLGHLLLRRRTGEEQENLGAAGEALTEAARRAPHRLEPVLNLALVHARLGHAAEARELAEAVVQRARPREAELKDQAERLLKALPAA